MTNKTVNALGYVEMMIACNYMLLERYWIDHREMFGELIKNPTNSFEYKNVSQNHDYVRKILAAQEKYVNYSTLLNAFGLYEEKLAVICHHVRNHFDCNYFYDSDNIKANGIKRYFKYINQVSGFNPVNTKFHSQICDIASVRHAIMHAHGNIKLLRDNKRVYAIISKYGNIQVDSDDRIILQNSFVQSSIHALSGDLIEILYGFASRID